MGTGGVGGVPGESTVVPMGDEKRPGPGLAQPTDGQLVVGESGVPGNGPKDISALKRSVREANDKASYTGQIKFLKNVFKAIIRFENTIKGAFKKVIQLFKNENKYYKEGMKLIGNDGEKFDNLLKQMDDVEALVPQEKRDRAIALKEEIEKHCGECELLVERCLINEEALLKAETAVNQSPGDETAKANLQDAKTALENAESELNSERELVKTKIGEFKKLKKEVKNTKLDMVSDLINKLKGIAKNKIQGDENREISQGFSVMFDNIKNSYKAAVDVEEEFLDASDAVTEDTQVQGNVVNPEGMLQLIRNKAQELVRGIGGRLDNAGNIANYLVERVIGKKPPSIEETTTSSQS